MLNIFYKLLRFGTHCRNGSPTKPSLQEHSGVWSLHWHTAPRPQMFPKAHGSRHL